MSGVRLGDVIIIDPDTGAMRPRFSVRDVPRHHLKIMEAVNQGLARRGGGPWWPNLMFIPEEAKDMVRQYVRDWKVWRAAAPVADIEGRRVA